MLPWSLSIHRPLYDWVVNNISIPYHKPRQIEFARLGIDHTVMSKRKLRQLVEQNYASGWTTPRMPTICGLRRRGYTPASIRNFSEQIGVAKADSTVEYSFLEHCLRSDLDAHAARVMAVLHPVRLTITNYPDNQTETFEVENHPKDPSLGTRTVPFSKHLYIEADDFMEEPVKKYKRLTPNGMECRLKGAEHHHLHWLREGRRGQRHRSAGRVRSRIPWRQSGQICRKIKGAAIHWVDAATAVDAEARLY